MPLKPVNPLLAAALHYLARGWSAIPVCPPQHQGCSEQHKKACKRPGKAPCWPWEAYQHRLATEKELHLFWAKNSHCNVGVCLGPVSGILGLDVDGSLGQQLLAELSGGQLPPTLTFKTPGGWRFLFKHPDYSGPSR
jgi:hypothetical protein